MTQDDKDKPAGQDEPSRFTPAEMWLFAIGGRAALVLVVIGSIAAFVLLAWFVYRLIMQNDVPIQ
jgi:hypothetical protein